MRFIRKNGRIIPIRDKNDRNDKSQEQSALKAAKNAKIKPKNVFLGASIGAGVGLTVASLKNVRSKSRLAIGGALLGAALGTARIIKQPKIKEVNISKEQRAAEYRNTAKIGLASGGLIGLSYATRRLGAFRPSIAAYVNLVGAGLLVGNAARSVGLGIRDKSVKVGATHAGIGAFSGISGIYGGVAAGVGLGALNKGLSKVKPIKNPVKKWAAAYNSRQTIVKDVPGNLKNVTPKRKLLGP